MEIKQLVCAVFFIPIAQYHCPQTHPTTDVAGSLLLRSSYAINTYYSVNAKIRGM